MSTPAPSTHTFTVFRGSPTGAITTSTTTKTISANEVLVKISHSGLCSTDSHHRMSGIVLGHEGIGTIAALGPAATRFRIGDVVGWGQIHETCGMCIHCLAGHEQHCAAAHLYATHDTDQGSLATHAVWREPFLFAIPPMLAAAPAAALVCAGATVFSALLSADVKATDVVGVVGLGALGQLTVQFAAKMGCQVVVFVNSLEKQGRAVEFGASEVVVVRGEGWEKVRVGVLVITTSAVLDWGPYLEVMERRGRMLPVTRQQGEMRIPYQEFSAKGLRILGAEGAGRYVMDQMLEFAARHQVVVDVDDFPMTEEGITKAFDKLDGRKLGNRVVLTAV